MVWKFPSASRVIDGALALGNLPHIAPRIEQLPEGKMVDLSDGVRTFLHDTGEYELQPVILLHGMAATGMLNWYQVFERMRGEYRLITFDQRWHGRGHRSDQMTFVDCAQDVLRVIRYLDLEQPIVAGYSMGGMVAQLAAREFGDELSGIVLAATGCGDFRNRLERLTMGGFILSADTLGGLPTAVAEPPETTPERAHRWALQELGSINMATNHRAIAEVGRFTSLNWLPEIALPAGIIKTMRDIAFPQKTQNAMADALPHSAVFPINAGHAACATHPDLFTSTVRAALNWVSSNQRSTELRQRT